MPLLRLYHRFSWLVARLTLAACATGLVVLVVITGWQVYGRYVLRATPVWVEGAALLLILFISFPGAALGVRERFHIGIATLPEMLPPRSRRMLEGFSDALLLLFGIGMVWWGLELTERTWNRTMPLIGLPTGTKYLPIVVSGALIILFTVERLLHLALYLLGKDVDDGMTWD